MYKLLIADDEPKIRRGLSRMKWNSIGIDVIGTAENGRIALVLAEELKPDIMFVDICMPFIGGMDLITHIKNILPDCVIIIITGYDEFEYAKEALTLKIFDYVLKPVNRKDLMETVKGAIKFLEENKKNKQYIDWAKYQVQNNKRSILQQFLLDWMKGRISDDKVNNQFQLLNIDVNKIKTLFVVRPLEFNNKATAKLESDLLMFCFENIIQEIMQGYDQVLIFNDNNVMSALVSLIKKDELINIEQTAKIKISKYLGTEVIIEYQIINDNFLLLPDYYSNLYQKINTTATYTPIVQLAKCLIDKRYYDQQMNLMEISEELHVSSAYLSRLIKKETGLSFKEYLTKIRINKAIEFMNNPTIKVYEIAENVGYSTQHYFSSAFKKITGVSPTVYRNGKDESN